MADNESVILEEDPMTQQEFDALYEYSCSLPTGTTVGKKWKRNMNWHTGQSADWVTCEYVPDPDPKMIGIKYRKPYIRPKPEPWKKSVLL